MNKAYKAYTIMAIALLIDDKYILYLFIGDEEMRTLTRSNLDIAVISKKEANATLLINKHCTVANNGRMLVEITRPEVDQDNYPGIDGIVPHEESDFMVRSDEAIKASKKIPKKNINPVLNQAIVNQNGKIKIASTDLRSENVSVLNVVEGNYPAYREAIPPSTDDSLKITVNPEYLETICKLAKEFKNHLNTSGEPPFMSMEFVDRRIKITARNIESRQEFLAVLMPLSEAEDLIEAREEVLTPESRVEYKQEQIKKLQHKIETLQEEILSILFL